MEIGYITERVAPGGRVVAADQLDGGVSATITSLEYALPDESPWRVIVRQYGQFDLSRHPELALDEAALLKVLRQKGLPVPEPLLAETGFRGGGSSWLVCEFIEGGTITEPPFPEGFVNQIAATLAHIHSIDPGLEELKSLEDGLCQAWRNVDSYARSTSGRQMTHHRYWQALQAHFPDTSDKPQALLHGDYWPGNLIWNAGQLVGVIDWEDAHLGEPIEDVANCHLELYLIGGPELADSFIEAYRHLQPEFGFEGLRFWELYVSARLLLGIPDWKIDDAEKASMIPKIASRANEALSRLTSK
jgi:aminoglycoside phosphotransferase (APT) family kinase protein